MGSFHEPVKMQAPILVDVKNLKKSFAVKTDIASILTRGARPVVNAVDGVSFAISEGEILGLVGESGSGKTTIGRMLVRLETPQEGEILVDGKLISTLRDKELRAYYRDVQMVFQDPYESINPRFTVEDTVSEPVKVQRLAQEGKILPLVYAALERAGLRPAEAYCHKFPHELSGGERQRLSIARALVMHPKLLVADEPVSMLDVSIKAGILNLLKRMSREQKMAILYVSHDLSTVKYLCDRIIFMYLGKFMEMGPCEKVIEHPRHPYARALKAAIPLPDPRAGRERVLSGFTTEKFLHIDSGCRFRPDCGEAMQVCAKEEPEFTEVEKDHFVACHRV
jgi:peptide/nickel transport system ATP-binding protein